MTMRYRWQLLRAGRLLLDGGGMFGLIPRVIWSRHVDTDDQNRIALSHNCLYLESEGNDPLLGRPRRVIVETGTGDKLGDKMSAIFGLDGRTIETALAEIGVDPETIDQTICTHLHFDHAGGLTRKVRDGEEPHWVATKPGAASGDEPRVRFTFPNAQLLVQRREWVDARNNDSVMTRTYYRDHILPFEDESLTLPGGRPRLVLVDSKRAYPLNRKPSRGDLPKTTVDERTTEVVPGIETFLVPGHTWGQQAVRFTDTDDNTVVFAADLIPTAWHAGAAYSLAYDVEAYTTMITKGWFLPEAAEKNWLLVLDHEPGEPRRRVRADDKGWFTLVDA
jgi:glyoxylase-like metal-dependent hydrolase (beta-lactamase superfamily II)